MLTLAQRVSKLEKQIKLLTAGNPGSGNLGSIFNSVVDVEHEYALRKIVELAEKLANEYLQTVDSSSVDASEILSLIAGIDAAEKEKRN